MSQRRIFLAAGSCSNAYANISVVYLLHSPEAEEVYLAIGYFFLDFIYRTV